MISVFQIGLSFPLLKHIDSLQNITPCYYHRRYSAVASVISRFYGMELLAPCQSELFFLVTSYQPKLEIPIHSTILPIDGGRRGDVILFPRELMQSEHKLRLEFEFNLTLPLCKLLNISAPKTYLYLNILHLKLIFLVSNTDQCYLTQVIN